MKKIYSISCMVLIVIISLSVTNVSASVLDWKFYEADNFIVFYPKGYKYQAKEILYYLENYQKEARELVGNQRDFKTHIVLQDAGSYSNGYANPVSYKIDIFTNNPSVLLRMQGLEDSQSWIRQVSIHEFTHIAQMTNYSGSSELISLILGNYYYPNLYSPPWITEGIAVYNESQTSKFEGRLNNGYYDAVIASKVYNEDLPSILEASYLHNHYPTGQWYLYGGTFLEYLADTYGEDKLNEYFTEYGSYAWAPFLGQSLPSVGIDKAAKKIYNKSFPELFADWQDYEEKYYQDWQVTGKEIIKNKRGRILNLRVAKGKLYYFKQNRVSPYPFESQSILSLVEYDPKTGREKILKELNSTTSSSLQVIGDSLYYAVKDVAQGFSNIEELGLELVNRLYRYNLKTGEVKKVLTDNFKDFSISNTGEIIYVKESKGKFGSEIWKYTYQKQEKLGRINELISEMEFYQGDLVIVSKEQVGSWGINYLDLNSMSLTSIVDTPWVEKFIKFKGDKLYFTANYEEKYSIYQYNLLTEKLTKLTSSDYAVDSVVYRDELYFVGVDAKGEGIYKEKLNPENYLLPPKEPAKQVDIDLPNKVKEGIGFTKNLTYLFKPYIRFPYLMGEDALGLNTYQISYLDDLDFKFNIRMLSPLSLSVSNFSQGANRATALDLLYPLYLSLEPGLSSINLDYQTDFNNSILGVNLNLSYPRQKARFNFQTNLNDNVTNSQVIYQYLLDDSSLRFKGSVFNNFNKGYDIRGFIGEGKNKIDGSQVGIDYVHKLVELREGIWNPNIFIGDVYGDLFIGHHKVGEINKTVYGYELLFEIGTAFNGYLIPRLGISISKGEKKPYLKFDTIF